jgi:hypothetical protein
MLTKGQDPLSATLAAIENLEALRDRHPLCGRVLRMPRSTATAGPMLIGTSCSIAHAKLMCQLVPTPETMAF